MKPRLPSYSVSFAALPLLVWIIVALLLAAPIWPQTRVVLGALLGHLPEPAFFLFLIGVVFVLPVLGLLAHLAVWVNPVHRERFRPHWSTHLATLLLLLPGAFAIAVLVLDQIQERNQYFTEPARYRDPHPELALNHDLYPFIEAPSLHTPNPFTPVTFDFNLPRPCASFATRPPSPAKGKPTSSSAPSW